MSEIVERVAKAIRQSDIENGHADEGTELVSYLVPARAAIEASRPDEQYFVAILRFLNCKVDDAHLNAVKAAHQLWIDEALK